MSDADLKNVGESGKPYGDDLAAAAQRMTLNVDAPVFVPSGGFFPKQQSSGASQSPSNANNESTGANIGSTVQSAGSQQAAAGTLESPSAPSGPTTTASSTNESSPSNEDVVDDWEKHNDGNDDDDDYDEEGEEMDDDGEAQQHADQAAAVKAKLKPRKNQHKRISEDAARKEHINVVFIGHVDAGKSTIGGQLLFLTGMVDKRTLEKYEREAKEKNRESWYLSWALDTNLEEREKGKTVEVGRAYFETPNKKFTLLDAPGHRGFVPNMIAGASQADLAVLVISARKGEFETGFERGGQTREHAMLAKTEGVRHLIVLINKMDDPTVEWAEERFNECRDKLLPYLKQIGFNIKTEVYFIPCSGLTGEFLKDCPPESLCPWYRGPSLLDYLDAMAPMNRDVDGPFKLPIVDKYKDMGTVVLGKIESGTTRKGAQLLLMPNRKPVEVIQLWADDEEFNQASAGENVRLKLKGVEEEEVSPGFVLCDPSSPCSVGRIFDAQVVILEHKSIICPGYSCVLHIHASVEEVTLKLIACLVDKKSGEKLTKQPKPRFVKQGQIAIMRFECTGGMICMETFSTFPQMGRFNLRDEGKTIGIGKVLRIVE